MSPLYCDREGKVWNVDYSETVVGVMKGACEVVSNVQKYLDPIENFLPFFQISNLLYSHQSAELFHMLLKISYNYINNLDIIAKNKIRYIDERETFLKIIDHQLNVIEPTIISFKTVSLLDKIINILKDYKLPVIHEY